MVLVPVQYARQRHILYQPAQSDTHPLRTETYAFCRITYAEHRDSLPRYETFITQGLQGIAPAVILRYYAKTGRTAIHRIKLEVVRKMRNLFFHLYNS